MEYELVRHPRAAASGVALQIGARVAASGTAVRFEYRLAGDLERVAIPALLPPRSVDGLWEHTCFEAFVAVGPGARYYELNFSPSTEWAAYAFEGYRQGMQPLALAAAPAITVEQTAGELRVTASVELPAHAAARWPWRVGFAAVVEERGGGRGYFALRHPRAKPDFHDAEGFAVLLERSAR